MYEHSYRTCVEIDLNKLQRNLTRIREITGPDCEIMEVMKADAYGHGLRMCSRYAAPLVNWFGVAILEEGLAVRQEAPDKPILVFGKLQDEELPQAARNQLTINLFSLEYAKHVEEMMAENKLHIDGHIKIDTGMNRLGLRARVGNLYEAVRDATEMFHMPNIHITGIYTHFACADTQDPSDREFTEIQYSVFRDVCELLKSSGLNIGLRHCTSTGGLLCYPSYRMEMVRTGMLPFGQSINEQSAADLGMEPILTWYAKVIDIRWVDANESISYGRIYQTKHAERIAVLSVGYADGYSRAFSNRTQVLLNGHKAAVRGKTCMDFIMVDITNIPGVEIGDQAILLGCEGSQWISADSLAEKVPFNTNGGVTTDINQRVRRIYRYDGKIVDESQVLY